MPPAAAPADEFAGFAAAPAEAPDEFAGFQAAPQASAETAPDPNAGAVGGTLQAAGHYLSTIPAALGGGLTYAGTLAATGNPEAAESVRQSTQNALTYDPSSPYAQERIKNIDAAVAANVVPPLRAANEKLGEFGYEHAGPIGGAAEQSAIPALLSIVGGARAADAVAGLSAEELAALKSRWAAADAKLAERSAQAGETPNVPAAPSPTPPAPAGARITGDALRAGPDPLNVTGAAVATSAAPAPSARVPVPGKPHITPRAVPATGADAANQIRAEEGEMGQAGAAPAPAAAAPAPAEPVRFTAPQRVGQQTGVADAPTQAARTGTLQNLNAASGGQLPEVRTSAVTGDYGETAVDHAHAGISDVPGQRMLGVIASENSALRTASENNVRASEGTVAGTDPTANRARGGIINTALQNVGDWFDRHISGSYTAADQVAGAQPHVSTNLANELRTRLPEGTPEGIALQGAAHRVAQQLGLIDGNGNAVAATGQQAERFRQWVGRQFKPGAASNGMIRDLKNATDDDAAARGGADTYRASRALRAKRDQMLDGPNGISNVMNSDRYGNRSVAIEDIPDHIAGLDKDQFDHVVNVLRSSAKLGNGELAEGSAAALREIRGHIAEKVHEAGASARSGKWDPYKYHQALTRYALNMPGVFDQPGEMANFKAVNDAGNILKMDQSYPKTAELQRHLAAGTGSQLRANVAGAAVGGAESLGTLAAHATGIPGLGAMVGPAMEISGASGGLRGMLSGAAKAARARAAEVEGRITQLGERPAPGAPIENRPLGQRIPGQGGFIGVPAQRDVIVHDQGSPSAGTIEHTYRTPDDTGRLRVTETPGLGVRQATEARIDPANRGQGWGTRMLQRAVDDAHAAGQVWHSDHNVSASQVGAYKNLAQLGYKVTEKGNTKHPGSWEAWGDHVFEVRPRAPAPTANRPLGEVIGGGKQRGAVGNPYDQGARPDAWAGRTEPEKPNRLPGPERTSNPYESGAASPVASTLQPLGARIGGGKQRGAAGILNPEEKEPTVSGADVVKHIQNTQGRGSKVSAAEARSLAGLDTGGNYKRVDYPVSQLKTDKGEIQAGTPEEYAAKKTPFPAITLDSDGNIRDGNNRVAAAKLRGDATIPAHVPIDSTTGEMAKGARPQEPATVNIGLHQGTEGQPGFRKMSKQEAVAALKSQGVNVGKTTVYNPKEGEPGEPTLVADIHRPLTAPEMQSVLAKTKQSAIPQRLSNGDGEMHVAPGHEERAAKEGWDSYNPDYFREHNGKTATENATSFNPAELEAQNFEPHPSQTVKNPIRNAYPGIYDDPKNIMSRLKTAPPDPIMQELFGAHVTRKYLHDMALSLGDHAPLSVPGMNEGPKARGSAAAKSMMTDENAERLRNVITAFKDHDLDAYHGMAGWYMMQPLHDAFVKELGRKVGTQKFVEFMHHTGMSSPASTVTAELNRGSASYMMAEQGKYDQYLKHGGIAAAERGKNFPPELENVTAHPYHRTAQAEPIQRWMQTGEGPQAVKTGTYVPASLPVGHGFQNSVLVGDSHFSRQIGLADVRTNAHPGRSITGPELSDVNPWFRDNVAHHPDIRLPNTSGQAVLWGALSHETGVETPVGAPKLELFAQAVKKAAARNGVTPQEQLKLIIRGKSHAG